MTPRVEPPSVEAPGLASLPEGHHDLLARLVAAEAAWVPLRDLAGRTVAVVGKGRREPIRLTLPGPTCRALADWIEVRGDGPGPLFHRLDRGAEGRADRLTGDGLLKVVGALSRAAGLDRPVKPHGLRHSSITAALDADIPMRDVMKFSRHRKVETLLRYDDARQDIAGKVARKVAGDRK